MVTAKAAGSLPACPVATSGALRDSGLYATLGAGETSSKLPNAMTRKD